MKINIFKIPYEKKEDLKDKFKKIELFFEGNKKIEGWDCNFYLSNDPEIQEIAWVEDYKMFIKNKIKNKIYFAVFLCERDDDLFALTYGKSHFYVRSFCDDDFGLEMAKRIANEDDIKQIATKRFNSRKKKQIRSYTKVSILNNESGESIEHLNASVIKSKNKYFGNKAKFGSSLSLSIKDLIVDKIPEILDEIVKTLSENPKFEISKTKKIKDKDRICNYNKLLIRDLLNQDEKVTVSTQSYDVVGTDFVFSGSEKYKYKYNTEKTDFFDDLNIEDIIDFIKNNHISGEEVINNVRVSIEDEGRKPYSRYLKDFIQYNVDDENVIFQNGKWIEFNKEYIKQIDESVSSVNVLLTEEKFKKINIIESKFNEKLEKEGYKNADKDFENVKLPGNYKIEAWDLKKDDTVYAVKFGSTQKLVYVCNQAINLLEILRNNASLKKVVKPKKYCLWLGITNKNIVTDISKLGSIIFKQQVDLFARKCREMGIEPVIKISQKIKTENNN